MPSVTASRMPPTSVTTTGSATAIASSGRAQPLGKAGEQEHVGGLERFHDLVPRESSPQVHLRLQIEVATVAMTTSNSLSSALPMIVYSISTPARRTCANACSANSYPFTQWRRPTLTTRSFCAPRGRSTNARLALGRRPEERGVDAPGVDEDLRWVEPERNHVARQLVGHAVHEVGPVEHGPERFAVSVAQEWVDPKIGPVTAHHNGHVDHREEIWPLDRRGEPSQMYDVTRPREDRREHIQPPEQCATEPVTTVQRDQKVPHLGPMMSRGPAHGREQGHQFLPA